MIRGETNDLYINGRPVGKGKEGSCFIMALSMTSGEVLWMRNLKRYYKPKSFDEMYKHSRALHSLQSGDTLNILYYTDYTYPLGATQGEKVDINKIEYPLCNWKIDMQTGSSSLYVPEIGKKKREKSKTNPSILNKSNNYRTSYQSPIGSRPELKPKFDRSPK